MSIGLLNRPVEIVITDHAVEEYRMRVDPQATEEEARAAIFEAACEARFLRPHCLGGHRYVGRGLVFAAKRDGWKFVVTTVFGHRDRYNWEVQNRLREMQKYIRLSGAKY